MIAHLYGLVGGKKHGSAILALSGLSQQLQLHSHGQCDNYLSIYDNPAYALRTLLQAPFQEAVLTYQEKAGNTSMSSGRVFVEWIFGDITTQIRFSDFKKT